MSDEKKITDLIKVVEVPGVPEDIAVLHAGDERGAVVIDFEAARAARRGPAFTFDTTEIVADQIGYLDGEHPIFILTDPEKLHGVAMTKASAHRLVQELIGALTSSFAPWNDPEVKAAVVAECKPQPQSAGALERVLAYLSTMHVHPDARGRTADVVLDDGDVLATCYGNPAAMLTAEEVAAYVAGARGELLAARLEVLLLRGILAELPKCGICERNLATHSKARGAPRFCAAHAPKDVPPYPRAKPILQWAEHCNAGKLTP